jgi:chitin disaccharide deacetylase
MAEADASPGRRSTTTGVLLCADDYAMTNGISRAIIELAEAGRLSATSAMTTSAHWPSHATWLARVRGQIATGLHLNLTLGQPLGPMPGLTFNRQFPPIADLTARSLSGRLDRAEIAAEIERQLVAFEAELGFAPDHIDGHQHVHVLPRVRDALLDVVTRRYGSARMRPLVRNPADTLARIATRRRAAAKAVTLCWLGRGFASGAIAARLPVNEGFGGVCDFAPAEVAADFAAAVAPSGPRHLVMCHPGFVDDELVRIDPVRERRQCEFDVLMREGFCAPIWRPNRTAGGGALDWSAVWTGTP